MKSRTIRKIYIGLLFILLLILLPMFFGMPEQTIEKTLILAFGVDKTADEFELSVQVMVPQSSQSGYSEKREVRSDKGKTIDEAMAKLQLKEGKELALAHANILLIAESAIEDDINIILDYFVRDRNVGYLTVATTPNNAKELLEISSQESFDKDSLLRLVSFNNENIYGTESTLNKILFGYYSPSKTSLVSRLMASQGGESDGGQGSGNSGGTSGGDALMGIAGGDSSSSGGESTSKSGQESGQQSQESGGSSQQSGSEGSSEQSSGEHSAGESSGGEEQSGQSSGQNSGNGTQPNSQAKKELGNDGSIAVLKGGKIATILDPLAYRGFHWLMPIKQSSFIRLENITDEIFNNATIIIDITNAKDKIKYEMTEDGTPIIKFKTMLTYQISSVQEDNFSVDKYAEFTEDSSKVIKLALQQLIDTEVQKALNTSKEYQIDVWNVYDKFYQKYGNKFINYVDNNEGDYLKDLEIFVEVNVKEDKL